MTMGMYVGQVCYVFSISREFKGLSASYFGNVINHLLDLFPALQAASGRRLQKIGSILDKYCAKRETDFTHQALPCTKKDLCALTTAITLKQQRRTITKMLSCLVCCGILLGRLSDTICLLKNQVAVFPGKNACCFI
jgi:hypothetical protein